MQTVKVFAASVNAPFGQGAENFGDALMTPLLNGLYGVEPIYTTYARAELIGVGSILDAYYRRKKTVPFTHRRPWRVLHVWGSGFMSRDSEAVWPQKLRYHAVRGPLTRDRVAGNGDLSIALGDPAILLPLVWPKPPTKQSRVAVVPHFKTYKTFVERYSADLPKGWQVIDLLAEPKGVAMQIAASEFVVSSSLHGLIVAEAYGVPSAWMEPHGRIKGDGFKFADYFGFIGRAADRPIDFEAFLKSPADWLDHAGTPKIADAKIERLLKSFPFQ